MDIRKVSQNSICKLFLKKNSSNALTIQLTLLHLVVKKILWVHSLSDLFSFTNFVEQYFLAISSSCNNYYSQIDMTMGSSVET